MPSIEAIKRIRKIKEIASTMPKHILKSLNKRLSQLSTDECITITIPSVEVQVSCMWDEGDTPTMNFHELTESPEDMLEDASDEELEKLGLSSITEMRARIQKEITSWMDEVARIEKAYSLDENALSDFLIEGHCEDN